MFLFHFWIIVSMVLIATCFSRINGFWFFSCPHGNGLGQAGDVCSAFCRCHPLNTCEAGIQKCAPPGVNGGRCHATRPCATGLSCHPGVQKCFHVPRRHGEPCVAGYECGSGLSCEPGVQVCFHHPRQYKEPCSAGYSCGPGLSCQPGYQRCLHHPRRENERCSAGYACADGLDCRLCDKPYATCHLSRVPAMTEQDYDRPFNKVAFLVTHNSFSYSPNFAVWARNQRFSVSQQLEDGVRGLMLDIYPGWGAAEVRLCHASCFWSGSSNLLDTLIEIRKFLETNTREVITIIFEDYLRNPTILKGVFDQAQISPHVLLKDNWGDGFTDWPTLNDMRRLGRLVVFNNNGFHGFPYTEFNMWYYVRENRYGNPGRNKRECVDRGESRLNAGWNDHWSLVLVNWFNTLANPLQPCLNSFQEIKEKSITCHDKFGLWANFIAVNYYTAGSGGGAFQAVNWLNKMFKQETSVPKERKASVIPFPLIDTVTHWNEANQHRQESVRKNIIDGPGYGKGFHDLSDIISRILRHHHSSWGKRNSTIQYLPTASTRNNAGSNAHVVSRAEISPNVDKLGRGHPPSESPTIFPDFERNDTFLKRNDPLRNHRIEINHDLRKTTQWKISRSKLRNPFGNRRGEAIHSEKSPKLANKRTTNHISTRKVNRHGRTREGQSRLFSSFKDKRRKIPKLRFGITGKGSGFQRGARPKFESKGTQYRSPPISRMLSSTLKHNTMVVKINPTMKIRNLRKQVARLRAKLNRYIQLTHWRTREKPKLTGPLPSV